MFQFFYLKTIKEANLKVCNIQCLSIAICKKIVKHSHKICNKHIEYALHPKTLDGISKLLVEELTRLGFNDVNMTLASTIEAMKFFPSNILGNKNT